MHIVRTLLLSPLLILNEWRHYFIALFRWRGAPAFIKTEIAIHFLYLIRTPYYICRRALKPYADETVQRVYGETFFTSMDTMLRAAEITSDDLVYDLGCGRGRTIFFTRAAYNCRCVGLDLTPDFIKNADRVTRFFDIDKIEFRIENIMESNFNDATILYIYASAFEEAAYPTLVNALAKAPPNAKIISVTLPLHELDSENRFEQLNQLQVPFVWGQADVFIYRVLTKQD